MLLHIYSFSHINCDEVIDMKRRLKMRRIFTLLVTAFILWGSTLPICAENAHGTEPISVEKKDSETVVVSDLGVEDSSLNLNCKSAILMEATTGAILYKQNADEALPPASVTKIMTLLLVMEAVDAGTVRLDDTISISTNAASMGGSQVYLKEGEQMKLEDLLKSVVIASANDAAVALAEYVAGSVPSFVEKMNTRADQLGMTKTVFENVTGLDDTAERHLTSAHDIAIMSKELIQHETILKYSSIWMDTIRDGAFGLTNTNRLVRFYPGCTGLKTGSTSKAGFCVSVTAERNDFSLICVVMGAESRDVRNAIASELLDWGFANYGIYQAPAKELEPISVVGGIEPQCPISHGTFSAVLPKGKIASVEVRFTLPERIEAPVKEGERVGTIGFFSDGEMFGSIDICAEKTVGRINFFEIMRRMTARFLLI
jgi:D-alanyl-D-alanine carboxypeptidase (penicillin-binding protein 5/6)